ncbi:collagen alpha-1(I) chain-like [Eschrichtius robustus]|uniref:collagen alpha-1(I) chain-like n=1 Tax=Eschrichtius robustus TaxID=9764 RepID=UPI0035C113A9
MVRRWRRGRPPQGEPSRAQGRAPGSRRAAPPRPRPRPRPRPPGPPPARREGRRRLTAGGGRPGRGGSRAAGKGRRGPRVPERRAGLGGGRRVTGARASRGASASAAFSPSSPRRGPAAPARVKRKRRQRRLGRRAGKVAKGPVDATWPRRKRRRPGPRSGACRGLARRCGGAPRSHLSASPSRRGRAAGGGDGWVVLAAGQRAGGGAERSERGAWSAGEHGPAQRRRGAPGRGPCSPPCASHGKVVSRLRGRRIHRRAGGPAAARSAGASAPPASSPPASLRPRARGGGARGAGRGRRGGGGALLAPVSSGCAAAAMRTRAPKSLAASPARASSLALPPAHAAGPGESGRVAAASPRPTGRDRTVRASPLRFLGTGRGGGRGRGRRNLFRSVLPAPPAHPRFPPLPSSAFARRRGEPALSPPPYPPRGRATSAVSKLSHHVGAPDPRPAGRLAAPTGSQPRVPALASSPRPRRPCPRPGRRPPRPGEAPLAAAAAPGLPGVLSQGPRRGGASRPRAPRAVSASGCRSRAAVPEPSAPGCRRTGRGVGPAGWKGLAGRCLCRRRAPRNSSTAGGTGLAANRPLSSGLGRLARSPAPLPPPPRNWQTLASDRPGSQSRLSHGQLCRSDPQGSPQPPRSLIASFSGQPAAVALSPDRSLAEARKSGGRAPPPSRSEEPTRSL